MILALEFSSLHRSAALLSRPGADGSAAILGSISDNGDRSIKPIPLIDQLLAHTHARREQIESLAIGLGPGS